jgi:ubiquinol-cytochrome c reductase cytochrome b subunit
MGFLEGSLRLMPALETQILGFTIPWSVLIPALVIPGIMFTAMGAYPFIEAWATSDRREHHILDRPRNVATRTGLGVMSITFFLILLVAGANDVMAVTFDLSINTITWIFRGLLFVLPPFAYIVTKRICLGLQRRDRDLVLHGRETGRIQQLPSGEMIEVHEPISDVEKWMLTQHEGHRPLQLEAPTDENGIPRRRVLLSKIRARVSRFYFEDDVVPPTPQDVRELESSGHH